MKEDHWGFLVDGKMIHYEEFPKNRDNIPTNRCIRTNVQFHINDPNCTLLDNGQT